MQDSELTDVPENAGEASQQQSHIWFADHVGTRGLEFIFPCAVRLRGVLDEAALCRAVDGLVERHSALRTGIVDRGGRLLQIIHPPYLALDPARPVRAEAELDAAVDELVSRPFDLKQGRALRAGLYRIQDDDHLLALAIHHVAADVWSMEVLLKDLAQLYADLRAGRVLDPGTTSTQYTAYGDLQRRCNAEGYLAESLEHWRHELDGASIDLGLPLDRPRPSVQSFRGDRVSFQMPAETIDAVARLARAEGVSEHLLLLAAYELLLARWSGRDDFIVGAQVANRPLPEFETVVGSFANILPMRARIDECKTFRELLRGVRESMLDALEYQGVSLDRLVEEFAPERELAHNPVVQTIFALEPLLEVELEGLTSTMVDVRLKISRYDIAVGYRQQLDGSRSFDAYYSTDAFERKTIEDLTEHFTWLVPALLNNPDVALAATPAASPTEYARTLGWGRGEAAPPPVEWFHEAVTRRAIETPERLAIAGASPLTFAELDQRADQVSALLQQNGAGLETLVGVRLPRSADLVVALLGILKAGATFVPLDPAQPKQRIDYIVEDVGIGIVITDQPAAERESDRPDHVRKLVLRAASGLETRRPVIVDGRNLAYVIYTSGSTGRPKGVEVTHEALANLVGGLEQLGLAKPGEGRVGWNASPSFDASVQQWCRLARGDALFPIEERVRRDPDELVTYIHREALTDLDITPSHLELIIDELAERLAGCGPIRLLVGGEAIRPALWTKLVDLDRVGTARSFNLYGPTEATVDTCVARIDAADPHLGRPLPGARVAVVDQWMRMVAPGVPGELVIGGAGLARGYRRKAGQTAARYVPDPYAVDGSRMYRTGDRVRWTRDGRLEYLGRLDRQIKLRGFRIELGEVENTLARIDGVGSVTVLLGEIAGSDALIAYCTRSDASAVTPSEIHTRASDMLPEYMLPAEVIILDRFDFDPNGKLDASRLPAPGRGRIRDGFPRRPTGAIETLIAEVWSEVLDLDDISADDDFFALGGHSLMAMRVVGRLKKRMRLTIHMTAVFDHPKLRSLAQYVEAEIRTQTAARQQVGE